MNQFKRIVKSYLITTNKEEKRKNLGTNVQSKKQSHQQWKRIKTKSKQEKLSKSFVHHLWLWDPIEQETNHQTKERINQNWNQKTNKEESIFFHANLLQGGPAPFFQRKILIWICSSKKFIIHLKSGRSRFSNQNQLDHHSEFHSVRRTCVDGHFEGGSGPFWRRVRPFWRRVYIIVSLYCRVICLVILLVLLHLFWYSLISMWKGRANCFKQIDYPNDTLSKIHCSTFN